MTQIYKFGYTVDNEIEQIYVFSGTMPTDEGSQKVELNRLFASEPGNSVFDGIFSSREIDDIKSKNIPVTFISQQIHLDDTIETIKKKLMVSMDPKTSFGEMYLFAKQSKTLNPVSVYQNLTQNGKLELTKDRLKQFLLNIDDDDINAIQGDKDTYDYDDIIALNLDKKTWLVSKPIGQKFVAVETTFPYTIDPFNVLVYDSFLERFAEKITTTTNSNLLMNTGPIHENMIYVCIAADVLRFAQKENLSEESTIKIYYPYLLNNDIHNLSELENEKQQLLVDSETMLTKYFEKTVENVNLFYDIFRFRKSELPYNEAGIKEIKLTIHPEFSFNLPLDVIFKLIHATREVPFIKYNPARRQEKIYRLYTDKIATNGKKIPYLSKSTIFKLVKVIGKNKSVTAYMEYQVENEKHTPITCEFESNGDITINAEFSHSMSTKEIDKIIAISTGPIISIVKDYLGQSGYTINEFKSLESSNVEVLDIKYLVRIPIKKKLNLKGIIGCLSSVFSVIGGDLSNGIAMRFKRVTDYNEMDSQEAYIVELLKSGSRDVEIIEGLTANFGKSAEEAKEKLAGFVSSLQLVQNAFQSNKLRIKNNPGFLTTMEKEQFDNVLTINVSGINDIWYLETIPTYIDSLLRITQDPNSISIPLDEINRLCRGKELIEDDLDVDIIAPASQRVHKSHKEESLTSNVEAKQMDIVEGELIFGETEPAFDEESGMLDMFGDSDDEDYDEDEDEDKDEDEDEDKDEDDDTAGGATTPQSDTDELETDLTGKSLANPNPFFSRMRQREPKLFLTKSEGKFKAYSRICPWNVKRQPVILTDEEKERIDENHPGSYDEAMKYGSDPSKKYWYICPRYWSLKDNTSLTEEEVKSGKFGNVIPEDAKEIPPGASIFEFTDERYHKGPDGKYIGHNPGFMKPSSHPGGKCLPCCFKAWDSNEQVIRRKECMKDEAPSLPSRQDPEMADDYIKGPDKFPLGPNRYGYLPIAIEKFLNTSNKKCQISVTNTNLKMNHPCILRHGVEISKLQSFIACIADVRVDDTKKSTQTIVEMKETLIAALSLDRFMTLQNGNLIEIFDPEPRVDVVHPTQAAFNVMHNLDLKRLIDSYAPPQRSKYTDSKIYRNTNPDNPSQMALLRQVIRSYENYISFLRDNDVKIDYLYLWDLICQPNPALFKNGLNMAIIELNDDDITDNVQVLCPSNHYAASFFEVNRKTIILMKIGNYFEPIYSFEDQGDHFSIIRRFSLKDAFILPNVKETLELIKMSMEKKCGALPSMPTVYKFATNIVLERLVHLLNLKNFKIESQVMNYNGRVIGVVASKDSLQGIIPCFPSAPMMGLTQGFTWMDDAIGDTYEKTLEFLNYVHGTFSQGQLSRVPCKPVLKILEDGLIVGILTQTNQFVALSTPAQDTFGDDMPSIEDSNYAIADRQSITSKKVDSERVKFINEIRLESGFFNVFRNTVRILLGQFKYRDTRERIENVIASDTMLYLTKLKTIDNLIRDLMKKMVSFTEYSPEILSEIGEITNCYNIDSECSSKKFCLSGEAGECALLVPKTNLINGQDNEKVYFGRMADEVIRYNRIKSFIFQPETFLAFSDLKYNLREDEIILLQSLLTQDYFDNLVPASLNTYTRYNTYDTAQPLDTQTYSDKIDLGSGVDGKPTDCPVGKTKISASSQWKSVFPHGSVELSYPNDPRICTFSLILSLMQQNVPDSKETNSELKEILINEYNQLIVENKITLLQILNAEGKKNMSKRVRDGQASMENMIMSSDYYMTNLDLWILAVHFNLPVILFSSTMLTENGLKILVAHSDGSGKYYFIRSPGRGKRADHVPKYKLIVANGISKIPLSDINHSTQEEIRAGTKENILMDYIHNFTPSNVKGFRIKRVRLKKTE